MPAEDEDRTHIVSRPPPPPPAPVPTSAGHSSAGDSGNALPIGTYLAEFELNSVLGEGGFGIVYLAWDHSLERRVALKEYMPASLASRTGATQVQVKSERHRGTFEAGMKSFINEAKLLAQFDHPSLVKVYRFWEANGTAYMVMPFYEGTTLKDRLKQMGGPPDEAWLLGMLAPLTEALSVIHHERCFHRDIAPDNVILLNTGGRPLLLDFGAARRVIGDMTQALTVILKPGYAPVEQYAEAPNMKQGGWTDVYALAASIHFAIMGRTPPTAVARLMSDSYVPLTKAAAGRYSERFLSAIDKALAVRPEDRTQTIGELRADLGLDAEMPRHAQKTTIVLRGDATGLAEDEKTQMYERPPAPLAVDLSAEAPVDGRAQPLTGEPIVAPIAAPMPAPVAPPVTAPKPMPTRSPAAAEAATPAPAPSRAPLMMGLGALVLVGGGIAAYMTMSSKTAAPVQAPPPVVAANPAPAPAPAAPTHFEALAQLDGLVTAHTPGFDVTAVVKQPKLRIGKDRLQFTVQSSRDGYVNLYVLDPDGALMVLFPNGQSRDNHIKAGQTLTLPQASWALETADPAGPEHFAVVVSAQQRDFAAAGATKEDPYLRLPAGPAADALLSKWTRPTPMLLGAPPATCKGTDCDAFGAARFDVEVVR